MGRRTACQRPGWNGMREDRPVARLVRLGGMPHGRASGSSERTATPFTAKLPGRRRSRTPFRQGSPHRAGIWRMDRRLRRRARPPDQLGRRREASVASSGPSSRGRRGRCVLPAAVGSRDLHALSGSDPAEPRNACGANRCRAARPDQRDDAAVVHPSHDRDPARILAGPSDVNRSAQRLRLASLAGSRGSE